MISDKEKRQVKIEDAEALIFASRKDRTGASNEERIDSPAQFNKERDPQSRKGRRVWRRKTATENKPSYIPFCSFTGGMTIWRE